MAWGRIGDQTATHPDLFRLLDACDGNIALRNEAYGSVMLLGTIMGAHCTDYQFSNGMAAMVAPGRFPEILARLKSAGWVVAQDDPEWQWKLTVDPEILHLLLKEEIEINRRREKDRKHPTLYDEVRVRDGDQCRICGKTVAFGDNKSARGGTIDSLNWHKESTVDTLFVSCRGCNSSRDDFIPPRLNAVPTRQEVYYTDKTIERINNSVYAKEAGIHLEPRQTRLKFPGGDIPGNAHAKLAVSQALRLAVPQPEVDAPGGTSIDAPGCAEPAISPSTSPPVGPRQPDDEDHDVLASAPEWVTTPLDKLRSPLYKAKLAVSQAPGLAVPQPEVDAPGGTSIDAPGRTDGSQAHTGSSPPTTFDGHNPRKTGGVEGQRLLEPGSGRDGSGRAGSGRAGSGKRRRKRGLKRKMHGDGDG